MYHNHAYIGSESLRHGIQVISLLEIADDALQNRTGVIYSPQKTYFGVGNELCSYDFCFVSFTYNLRPGSSHNLFINQDSGYLYVLGSNECDGGLHVVDLYPDPEDPTFVACYDGIGYVHDVHCE